METVIINKNPQAVMKAMQTGTFMCIADADLKFNEVKFNKNMLVVGTISDLKKIETWAKENNIDENVYCIHHICSASYSYKYNF